MEAIPPNAPLPRGKEVDLCMFVDSNHLGNNQTRRSRTWFMIHMNMSLINWYSKKQSTIKTSEFGAEFVAMNVTLTLHTIQYKLRLMCISISGALYIYGDNMLVIHSTSKLKSTLKKKCNAIAFPASISL